MCRGMGGTAADVAPSDQRRTPPSNGRTCGPVHRRTGTGCGNAAL